MRLHHNENEEWRWKWKKKSHRNDINRPMSRHGQKHSKY